MKVFFAIVLLSLTVAEPPPSNSYLPPPPGGRNGYSQSQSFGAGPEIIAARSLNARGSRAGQIEGATSASGRNYHDNEVQGSGFSSSPLGHGTPQARFGYQGYENAAAFGRNALDKANTEPANYNFGYMVNDQEGTEFGHHEERQEERAQGEYHVVLPDGKKQTVNYEADERGFKPQITYQDTVLARSGYDSNAQSFRGNGGHSQGNARSGGY